MLARPLDGAVEQLLLVAVGQTREVKLTGHDAAQGEQQSSRAPQPIHVSVVERGMFSSGKR